MNGNSLLQVLSDVEKMMKLFEQSVRYVPTSKISSEEKKLRSALIAEETKELLDAIKKNDLDKIADGIIDVIVVTLGTAAAYGIPVHTVWNEIMVTNMAKANGPKDPETGKRLKPKGWKPPNIKNLLKQHGWDEK